MGQREAADYLRAELIGIDGGKRGWNDAKQNMPQYWRGMSKEA